MSPSYQLPDLLSFSRRFELRTNRSCRSATTASEAWLLSLKTVQSTDVLTNSERRTLRPMKAGLLAALCFPDCDVRQLRFLTDFMTLLILSTGRGLHVHNLEEFGWREGYHEAGISSLEHHELFQYLWSELGRFASRVLLTSTWETRFTLSVHSYRAAQLQGITNRLNNKIPDLETYVALRRDLSGLYMIFDLFELVEGLKLPPMDEKTSDKFSKLKQYAADIIAYSLDVIAFNRDQAQGNCHNLISVLMTHERLSIQGALNRAGTMIKKKFDEFVATERSLLDPPTLPVTDPSAGAFSSYWRWIQVTRVATSPSLPPATDPIALGDIPSYVRTLEDCIVGTINWAYETELYFGKKGEEIRTFGWVFLSSKRENEER